MSKYNALIEKRDEMEADYDAYLDSPEATVDGANEKQEALKSVNNEIEKFDALEKSRSEMKAAAKARAEYRTERPFGFSNDKKDQNSVKSLGQVFFEADGYKKFLNKDADKFSMAFPDINLAAIKDGPPVFSRNGLSYPDQERGVNLVGRTALGFTDLFSQSGTQRDAISFLQQTTLNRAAAPTGEGVKKPYANNNFIKNTVPVKKIAVLQKVTDEQLADFQESQAFLNDVLVYDARKNWDENAASGNGTDPQILGVFGYTTIPTFAKASTDTVVDAIYRGIAQVENLGYTVDYVTLNLADWVPIRLSKTNQGIYYFGDPGVDGTSTIFGKKVFTNSVIPVGTALVGNFKAAGTWYSRDGIRVELTNSNVDDFENNLITMRVESRNALAIKRPDALVKITGLDG